MCDIRPRKDDRKYNQYSTILISDVPDITILAEVQDCITPSIIYNFSV